MGLRGLCLGFFPLIGQEFGQAGVGVGNDAGQDVAQVGEGIETERFAGLGETVKDRRIVHTRSEPAGVYGQKKDKKQAGGKFWPGTEVLWRASNGFKEKATLGR